MELRKLCVHPGGRYLMWSDGEPFFYMADTAWELLHRVALSQIPGYLDTRKNQGFNAVQVVALAEAGGLSVANPQGHLPTRESYWQDLDQILDMAAGRGMVVALLPSWGDKWNQKGGIGPEVFNPQNAYSYGKWLGSRYREAWNLIWVLGGDRPVETDAQEQILDAMAEGLREGDKGNHLMTFHPCGAASSADFLKGKAYLDFHSIQSGHGLECYESVELLEGTWQRERRPVLDMECRYEDFPACFDPDLGYCWTDADVRNSLYWNLLWGSLGAVYGHRDVWCFCAGDAGSGAGWQQGWNPWQEALHCPGAEQIRHLVKLRLMRPYFELQSSPELLSVDGQPAGGGKGPGRMAAARGEGYAYIYSPLGMPIRCRLDSLGFKRIRASWYNPRNGALWTEGIVNAQADLFCPPASGKGQDWVLVLDKMD